MSQETKMHILPSDAYFSQQWFDKEQRAIFSNTWYYAGFREDVSEPGQYKAIQAGLNNIFIVMGRDRRLRAFHNICRHRGTQLLRTVGKIQKAITCPYHDWTYDLEGNLVSVPNEENEFPNLDKTCFGLKPAAVDIWRSMIFVHPDPKAISLGEWFGEIEPYLGPHDVDELVEYPEAATSHIINANWKIVAENYIDVYHLSHLHAGTLNMYDHSKAKFGFVGPHYAFWEPLAANYLDDIEMKTPMPLVVATGQEGAYVPMLFPGIGLSETESSWSTFHIIPLAPNQSRVETRMRVKNTSNSVFYKQERIARKFWQKTITTKYEVTGSKESVDDPMLSSDFMQEDIYVCEQQQKSLTSPYLEMGPSAKKEESPVRQHQQIVLDWLRANPIIKEY